MLFSSTKAPIGYILGPSDWLNFLRSRIVAESRSRLQLCNHAVKLLLFGQIEMQNHITQYFTVAKA